MARPSRIRRVAKRVGLVLTVLVGVAAVLSGRWNYGLKAGHVGLLVGGGCAVVSEDDRRTGMAWGFTERRRFGFTYFWFWTDSWPTGRAVGVPMWAPFAAVALLTAFLFWRDRRRFPPGHCRRCGYDLTGNVSGRCPECGEAV